MENGCLLPADVLTALEEPLPEQLDIHAQRQAGGNKKKSRPKGGNDTGGGVGMLPGDVQGPQPLPSTFEVRVIYVRVSACHVDGESPEVLQLRCLPREIGSELEVNGARIAPQDEACLFLKCDRVDCESAEATYVSTDRLRAGGSLSFEVSDGTEPIVFVDLHKLEQPRGRSDSGAGSQAVCMQSQNLRLSWNMDCTCVVGTSGSVFLRGKQTYSTPLMPPSVEVCVVGRYNGAPVILTETVLLTSRRRNVRKGALDAIPELEEQARTGSQHQSPLSTDDEADVAIERQLQPEALLPKQAGMFGGYYDLPATEAAGYGLSTYEGEDGEMSWFNAGVRVGVGLGLGICIGVGIGVGIIVRTYQATTRTFRRSLF